MIYRLLHIPTLRLLALECRPGAMCPTSGENQSHGKTELSFGRADRASPSGSGMS